VPRPAKEPAACCALLQDLHADGSEPADTWVCGCLQDAAATAFAQATARCTTTMLDYLDVGSNGKRHMAYMAFMWAIKWHKDAAAGGQEAASELLRKGFRRLCSCCHFGRTRCMSSTHAAHWVAIEQPVCCCIMQSRYGLHTEDSSCAISSLCVHYRAGASAAEEQKNSRRSRRRKAATALRRDHFASSQMI
jgi:hypothetical protein